MTVKEAKEYIKKYDGFKELKAIGIILVAIYEAVCLKDQDLGGRIMERQYTVRMTITVDDEVVGEHTLPEVVLEVLEDAPFQVDCIQVDQDIYMEV